MVKSILIFFLGIMFLCVINYHIQQYREKKWKRYLGRKTFGFQILYNEKSNKYNIVHGGANGN